MDANSASNLPKVVGVALLIFAVSLVFALFSIFQGPASSQAVQSITITTGNWQPYSGETLNKNGAVAAIVTEALKQIGYTPQYRFTLWDDALNKARENENNSGVRASFPWFYTQERAKSFYYSDALWEIDHSFYVNADNTAGIPQNVDELCQFQRIVIRGYELPDDIRNKLVDKCDANNSSSGDKPKVHDDVVDALLTLANSTEPLVVVEASSVVEELVKQNKKLYGLPVQEAFRVAIPLHLITSKRNPYNLKFIKRFNKALADIGKEDIRNIFTSTLASIDNQNRVLLEPINKGEQVLAYLTPNKEQAIVLPEGSSAVVDQWPAHYIVPEDPSTIPGELLVPIRLIDGPQKGYKYFVDGRSIRLP